MNPMRPSFIEINLRNLRENVRKVKEMTTSKILAVVKADAYGHGAVKVSQVLEKEGIEWFGVGIVEEGAELRENGIKGNIVLLSQEFPERIKKILEYNLIPCVSDLSFLHDLEREAKKKNKKVPFFLFLDTGMGRYGILPQELPSFLEKISSFSSVEMLGIMSHFPSADTDPEYTKKQLSKFLEITEKFSNNLIRCMGNSSAFLKLPESHLNMVRLGILLYGIPPFPMENHGFKPVMHIKSRIAFIKELPKGSGVSYGRTCILEKPAKIAVVPIGYADGYDRHLSNRGWMMIRGKKAPIKGVVTMDATMVDVTHIEGVRPGDEVIVMDDGIDAWTLARLAGTVPYEIVSRMGKRLPRNYIE